MTTTNLDDLPARSPFPGWRGKFVRSAGMTFVYWDVPAGTVLPEHSHPHEQVAHTFEGEFEIGWGEGEEFSPVIVGGELVEGEIAADDGESLGVFAEAFVIEAFLGEPAARGVALARIDLIEPAFIFPGTGSDENVFGC